MKTITKTMSKLIIIPKFTLSANTAVLPSAVFVHHNALPLVIGRIYNSLAEATEIRKHLPSHLAAGASSNDGRFHLVIVFTESLTPEQVNKLPNIASRMLDWYIHNGINQ
jgi:hypothetical protein